MHKQPVKTNIIEIKSTDKLSFCIKKKFYSPKTYIKSRENIRSTVEKIFICRRPSAPLSHLSFNIISIYNQAIEYFMTVDLSLDFGPDY